MGSVCFSSNGTDGLLLDPKDLLNVGITYTAKYWSAV
jgi:hypothetical protein